MQEAFMRNHKGSPRAYESSNFTWPCQAVAGSEGSIISAASQQAPASLSTRLLCLRLWTSVCNAAEFTSMASRSFTCKHDETSWIYRHPITKHALIPYILSLSTYWQRHRSDSGSFRRTSGT